MSDQNTEVQAEGLGNVVLDQEIDVTEATPIIPQTEELAPIAKPATKKLSRAKNNVGAVNTRWTAIANMIISSVDLGVLKEISFDPYAVPGKGDSISRAFRRNVWVTGTRSGANYIAQLVFMIQIARAPQISGALEITDSGINSSRYIVEFGSKVEFPVIPNNFAEDVTFKTRFYNNPWYLTSESKNTFNYKLIGFNRNGDIADVNTRLFVKPGNSQFGFPRKPTAQEPVIPEIKGIFNDQIKSIIERNLLPTQVWT